MAMPDDANQHGWVAVLFTAVLGLLGVAWKSWFGIRKDARDDRKGEVVNGTYESIIETLREQLEEERTLRRAAEQEVSELRRQLAKAKYEGL